MLLAAQISKYLLRALNRTVIPTLEAAAVPQILAAPPYDFSQCEHWQARSKYLPHRTPELTQVVWAWKNERMITSRMPYIGFVYEGVADEKVGLTTQMAKALATSGAAKNLPPHGITVLRLPAPAVICFPPGVPRRDGSQPSCETGRPGFAPSGILWMHVAVNELLVHYCESGPDRIFSSHALCVKDVPLYQLANVYLDELHQGRHEGRENAQALLLVLMKRLRRYLLAHNVALANTTWPSHNHIAFKEARSKGQYLCQQAVEFIVMNLREPITWKTLEKQLGCSPHYLNRIFQKYTGMPLMRYVTHRRIEAAKLLLAQSDRRIGEVAHLTGFVQIDSFSTCFKRLVGCSPSEFRSQMQAAPKTNKKQSGAGGKKTDRRK